MHYCILLVYITLGQPLAKLVAEDEDKNQAHTFRIVSDASGLFSTDGQSLMASVVFDYEQDPGRQFTVVVECSDDGQPPMKVKLLSSCHRRHHHCYCYHHHHNCYYYY
jgi:hypothetical protein